MRWFTNRFEEGWHPQPNEQVGFLVLDTQSYSQSDSETPSLAGEKLGFEGWLDYKYTGNLFLNSPPVLQIFLERIEKSFNHPPETQGSNKAVDENIVFAKDIVTKFLEERFGELKENAMNLQGALEALNIMQSHLLEAVDKVFDCLRESSYDSDLIKPILSATFEDAKTNDEKKIKRLVGLAKKWAEGNNESEDITFPETITDRHIHVLFYINLFMRRVLLEIPQTLEIGFAPYFMEVGFADYTRLEDARNFTPRRESDIEKTGISGKNDAVYKLLGEIERLFGIGGKDEWTFYMPSAPLFGHGQRRDFCCGLLSSELAKRVREANEKQAEVSQ
jgi:hypothetical protein